MQSVLNFKDLSAGKKLYFASDFHLGIPDREQSLAREKKIVRWLTEIEPTAGAIFLVGDLFDFWFEYPSVIPKGFIRFQGKLAELRDRGIPIYIFTGNHDMWMSGYFEEELGIPVFHRAISVQTAHHLIRVGHGDGLGPGDYGYKFLKLFFKGRLFQWMFRWLHPTVGVGIATFWSKRSRLGQEKNPETFMEEKEWLYQHCLEVQSTSPHDFYVFGHRHLPIQMKGDAFEYVNLGEWVHHCTYGVYDGHDLKLETFEN